MRLVGACGERRNDEPIGDEAREALRLVANVDVVGIRQRRRCGGVKPERGTTAVTVTISLARGTVSGRSTSVSATLNIAALAPTPMAIDTIATNEKPGFFTSIRAPCFRSCKTLSTIVDLTILIVESLMIVDCGFLIDQRRRKSPLNNLQSTTNQ